MHEQATDERPEMEEIRCPQCGGLNRADASWCGQCLERFAPPKPIEVAVAAGGPVGPVSTGPPPPPPPTTPSAATPTASGGAFSVGSEGITWACKQCDSVNSFDVEVCSVCGTSFADLLRPPEPARPERDPNTVALVSLFFPGAGHGYMGLWGQAIARGIISAWVMVVAVIASIQEGIGLMPVVFGLIGFFLWLIAAHDSYREACGTPDLVLLKRRYFLWVVLGLLMLMMVMLVMQGLQANNAAI